MKKILFLILVLMSCNLFAQSGSIIIHNTTDYTIEVVLYAYAPSSCSGGGCGGTYKTLPISIQTAWGPTGSTNTWGSYTPCNVSSSPGWDVEYCSTTWCSSLPSDFQWTYAEVTLVGGTTCWGSIFPLYVGDATIACSPATSSTVGPIPGCSPWNLKIEWNPTSGIALGNVILKVIQY